MTREEFMHKYAERSNVSLQSLLKYRVVVPAAVDRGECDYKEECEGWHVLPIGCYTSRDVQSGFISQELLDWVEGRLP